MKLLRGSTLLLGCTIFLILGLASCGSDNTTSIPASTSTSFAYLQSDGVTPNPTARSQSHSALLRATHTSRPRAAIASVNIAAGSWDLYVMDTQTNVSTKLNSQGSLDFYNVQLSADGTKLMFTAYDSTGYIQIYLADALFKTLTAVTSDSTDHLDATISYDGTMIAYNDGTGLYTIPASGGTQSLVIDSSKSPWGGATFTPDGKKIVFAASNGGGQAIYIANLNGTNITQLSSGTQWDDFPIVSPDGKSVVFGRVGLGLGLHGELNSMDIGGETAANPVKQLAATSSWQPTYMGSKILFGSTKDSATSTDNIYIMDSTGSNVERLTNTTLETAFNVNFFQE